MTLGNRSITLFSIMMLFIILLPAVTGLVGLTVENEFPEDDDYTLANSFMASWARMPIHQLVSGLMLGISMFTLFVVYLGGRSNHRRFNDRTLDSFNLFGVFFSRRLYSEPSLFSCPSHLIHIIQAMEWKSHSDHDSWYSGGTKKALGLSAEEASTKCSTDLKSITGKGIFNYYDKLTKFIISN